jgi:hypothetical protein
MGFTETVQKYPLLAIAGVGAVGFAIFKLAGNGGASNVNDTVPGPITGQEPGTAYVSQSELISALHDLETSINAQLQGQLTQFTPPQPLPPFYSPTTRGHRGPLTGRDLAALQSIDAARNEIQWSNN